MSRLALSFTVNEQVFTKSLTLEAIRKSGFIADQLDVLEYKAGNELPPFDISNLSIKKEYCEKVIDIFALVLEYLTTPEGEVFSNETIVVSKDYTNAYVDDLFKDLPHAYCANLINLANFMIVPSIFHYLIVKLATIIHTKSVVKSDSDTTKDENGEEEEE